jgi:hypothetical protein
MLGLGLGINKGLINFLPAWLKAYVNRVQSDGGANEGLGCARTEVSYLIGLDRTAFILAALEVDLAAEGGVLEARDCFINSMEELHTII